MPDPSRCHSRAPLVRLVPWLLALPLAGMPLPAAAGSVTASSIWDRQNAIQRAQSQIPRGGTVTGTTCQEVDMRGTTRYLCTVTYTEVPTAPAEDLKPGTPSAMP